MDRINYFWKINTTETLGHAYTYTHMQTYAQALHAHVSCMRTHTRTCVCMLRFQKLCKTSFFAFRLGLEWIPYCLRAPQTSIFQLYKAINGTFSRKKNYDCKTHKIHQEIVNQRWSFLQNILKSSFIWLRPFWSWS